MGGIIAHAQKKRGETPPPKKNLMLQFRNIWLSCTWRILRGEFFFRGNRVLSIYKKNCDSSCGKSSVVKKKVRLVIWEIESWQFCCSASSLPELVAVELDDDDVARVPLEDDGAADAAVGPDPGGRGPGAEHVGGEAPGPARVGPDLHGARVTVAVAVAVVGRPLVVGPVVVVVVVVVVAVAGGRLRTPPAVARTPPTLA